MNCFKRKLDCLSYEKVNLTFFSHRILYTIEMRLTSNLNKLYASRGMAYHFSDYREY